MKGPRECGFFNEQIAQKFVIKSKKLRLSPSSASPVNSKHLLLLVSLSSRWSVLPGREKDSMVLN